MKEVPRPVIMCVFVCVCLPPCVFVGLYMYLCAAVCDTISMCVHVHQFLFSSVYLLMCFFVYPCISVCVHIFMFVSMYFCVCVHLLHSSFHIS